MTVMGLKVGAVVVRSEAGARLRSPRTNAISQRRQHAGEPSRRPSFRPGTSSEGAMSGQRTCVHDNARTAAIVSLAAMSS